MRKILIVNDSKTVRTLLSRYILAELTDFEIHEAASGEEAIQRLQEIYVDVIISGNKMRGMDGPALHKFVRGIPSPKKIPFIVITSSKKEEALVTLVKEGVEHFLISPFTSRDLGTKINSLCNPAENRAYDRVSIPGAIAQVHLEHATVETEVINLSTGGMVYDFLYSEEYGNLMKSPTFSLQFPKTYDGIQISNLRGRFLRMIALTSLGNHLPKTLRIGWQFVDVSNENQKKLKEVCAIAMAEMQNLEK